MAFAVREKANNRVMSDETKAAIAANRSYTDLTFSVIGSAEEPRKNFSLSKAMKVQMGLDSNGLITAYDSDSKTVVLIKTDEKKATLFKGKKAKGGENGEKAATKAEKGRSFSSDNLVLDMQDAGLLPAELTLGTKAKFDIVPFEGGITIGDSTYNEVYQIVVEAEEKEDDEVEEATSNTDSDDETETTEEVVSTPTGKAKKGVLADDEF